MTLMDSLSVWYSAGLEAIRLSQVQVQLLLGFIAQDNLQVCCEFLQVVVSFKGTLDVAVVVYGRAAHTGEQTCGSPSSFYREDVLLILTVFRFTLQSCQCAPPEHKKKVEGFCLRMGLCRNKWQEKDGCSRRIRFIFCCLFL